MVIKVLRVVVKARVAQGVRLKYKVKHGGEMKGTAGEHFGEIRGQSGQNVTDQLAKQNIEI